ncbi:undecaprenyl-diphosphatase [Streptomyces sp. Ag109_G2-6]|uniref:phosphatase PAP2 family protein n=1 Tax=Streptomyces sp. Ag109_G2-6 TaxID=2485154 RepID=UPI000F4D9195|nr:phosphatase PAP2 family protein [Streptomyces sp. Ag109_G2-6]RPF29803.1 undecaprenyl-diphosphatase [Streptomyces sp. Ag109_G2-6]
MDGPAPDGRPPAGLRGLTPAARTALAASAAFALLTLWVILAAARPLPFDTGPHAWSLAHRPPAALDVARAVTATGTGVWPYALVVLAGLYAGRAVRDRLATVAGLALCLALGQGVRRALMSLVARPRPPAADWATHAANWSFPSGHATTGALTAGLLLVALALRGSPGPARTAAAALIVLWGAAVGLSRVYLGVHWLSDVLGGWLLATAWLALAALVRRSYRREPAART